MNYKEKINLEDIVKWRNHLHENPELSFEEVKTSQYIFDVLSTFDNLVITRPTKTSVVAVMDTTRPGKTIALRADIDALPMEEFAEVDYKSKNVGVMHSCGHDTHTAMLLGAVQVLTGMKDELNGKVKFIFQHAEEVLPGGAVELVAAGVISDVDEIYGLHIGGGLPLGLVGGRSGFLTASADTFEVKLKGHGAHGSTPEVAKDLVVVGAQIVNALQTIVSRNVAPIQPAVVTVGQFNIGSAPNIIADTGYLSGTIRALDKDTRQLVNDKVEKTIKSICLLHDVEVEVKMIWGYSSVTNNPDAFENMNRAVLNATGHEVTLMPPLMGAEDFSAYTDAIPGCFLFVGGGSDEGYQYGNHHPKFRIHKDALAVGTSIHIATIIDRLGK